MTTVIQRAPRYARAKTPPPMRLTERDQQILEAVHVFDGVMSFSQVQRLFFTGKSQAEHRLRLLYEHGYLNRPNLAQRRRLPEMVYWLDRLGAEVVASRYSMPVREFVWRQAPRWSQVEHDLAVNDFRLDMEVACHQAGTVELETWIPESEFWAHPDRVEYSVQGQKQARRVRPDGYFILRTAEHRLRFLLEIDRSTEDNPRFLREKLLPGRAYIRSEAYAERFGHNSGRWLVVTTGLRRMHNLLQQASRAKVGGLFYFTTFEQAQVESLLFDPIWQRCDREELVGLLTP